jgi:hypothetical protein
MSTRSLMSIARDGLTLLNGWTSGNVSLHSSPPTIPAEEHGNGLASHQETGVRFHTCSSSKAWPISTTDTTASPSDSESDDGTGGRRSCAGEEYVPTWERPPCERHCSCWPQYPCCYCDEEDDDG